MSQNIKKKIKNNNNKSKSSNKPFKKKTPTTPTCYKCGKVGHYSKDCQLENQINSLEISDKLKNLMIWLIWLINMKKKILANIMNQKKSIKY